MRGALLGNMEYKTPFISTCIHYPGDIIILQSISGSQQMQLSNLTHVITGTCKVFLFNQAPSNDATILFAFVDH